MCLALLVDPEDAELMGTKSWKRYNVEFQTHRPHTGTQLRPEKYEEVIKKGDKITPEEAQKLWDYHYDSSKRDCIHMFWDGRCKNATVGFDCGVSKIFRYFGGLFFYSEFS